MNLKKKKASGLASHFLCSLNVMCVLFMCDKMFPALLSLSASIKSGRRRIKGRGRYSFWNHCQINSLCPALVCSFKHKDLFGTRVSGRSNREQTRPFPGVRWYFGRQCDPALRKKINQCMKKKQLTTSETFLVHLQLIAVWLTSRGHCWQNKELQCPAAATVDRDDDDEHPAD